MPPTKSTRPKKQLLIDRAQRLTPRLSQPQFNSPLFNKRLPVIANDAWQSVKAALQFLHRSAAAMGAASAGHQAVQTGRGGLRQQARAAGLRADAAGHALRGCL